MNVRKSSLPLLPDDELFGSKDISLIKHLCNIARKRLVSSCSKINNDPEQVDFLSAKCHSFPASVTASQGSSLDNGSSTSITDTLLKVRRLTQIYDEGERVVPCKSCPKSAAGATVASINDHSDSYFDPVDTIDENPRQMLKLGDRSFKLPSKAAAILGANDSLIHQLLHDNGSQHSHALIHENKIKKTTVLDFDVIDKSSKIMKSKKKTGIGSEVKERIASLWKQSDLASTTTTTYYNSPIAMYSTSATTGLQIKDMEKMLRVGKATVEQIRSWSRSFESLLHDKFGLAHFHDFLRSEFSDENIEFWIACEEYRTITNNKKLQIRAEKIYNDYVGVQAAREVNLDSRTRQQTEIDIQNASLHTFDQAQKRIQALMEKDSYQRFLRSELYGKLLRASEQYHISQLKTPSVTTKNLIISNLEMTAQDLTKLTMTTSKLGSAPRSNSQTDKCPRDRELSTVSTQMTKLPEEHVQHSSTEQPDEPSLPFSNQSMILTPDVE